MRPSSAWRHVVLDTRAASKWLACHSGQLVSTDNELLKRTYLTTLGAIEAKLDEVRKFRTTIRNQQAYLGEWKELTHVLNFCRRHCCV